MTRFEETLENYVYYIQKITNEHYTASLPSLTPPVIEIDPRGKKYKRIVKRQTSGSSRSVHSFVEVETGNVYKARGWKAPELNHVRANIYDDESIKNGVNEYGANYIVR